MYEEIVTDMEDNMRKAVNHTLHEFSTLHTGKASPSMVEDVLVKAYGGSMRLKETAAITTPDLRTLKIQPWDKSLIQSIEKAIHSANIGLNPSVDGPLIWVPIPELTGDRRRELVKVAHRMAESGRISVRLARREAMNLLKDAQKEGEISKDDLMRWEKEVQQGTDKFIGEIDSHLKIKTKELTEI